MDERIRQRISSFFKRWYSWIVQFLVWLLLIVRDNYATDILNSLTDKYGGKIVKGILMILPKDVSGYALLLLVASVGAILIYDLIDTRRKEKLDKEQIFKLTAREPIVQGFFCKSGQVFSRKLALQSRTFKSDICSASQPLLTDLAEHS